MKSIVKRLDDFKPINLEESRNYYVKEILCLDGNFSICISCRINTVIWM